MDQSNEAFELSIRVKCDDDDDELPKWPIKLMISIANYLIDCGILNFWDLIDLSLIR